MGKKNSNKKNKSKPKQENNDKSSMKSIRAETLVQQAVQGFQLLQECDDNLEGNFDKILYVVDLQWFLDWQDYVGMNALYENLDPLSEKTFGKGKPTDQNRSYIKKKTSSFHTYPKNMPESIYYNVFLDTNFSEDNIRILDERTWRFLQHQYPDLVEIPRAQLWVEEELSLAIELDNVWFGMFDSDTIKNYVSGPQKEKHDNYDFYKIQVAKCLNYDRVIDLWIRFYLNRKYGSEEKRDQFKFRVWKLDQTLHIQSTINILNQEMREETYRVKGEIFEQAHTKGNRVKHFMSQHYKYMLEVVEKDKNWYLKQHPMKKIGELCPKENGFYKGICEYCQKEQPLSEQCMCKQIYYCSLQCQYKDKKFHSHMCEAAYDSESDDELDKQIIETNCETGLANLGNTCYMNSGLQCLLASKQITEFFKSNTYKEYLKKDEDEVFLSLKFAKLIKEVKAKRSKSIEPWAFKIQFGNYFYSFKGFNQHDAQEFVQNMLEIFSDQFQTAILNEQNEDDEESGENNIQNDKSAFVYNNSLSKEENDALEFFTNIQTHMYSKLFSETFLGVFKSKLSCTGCNKSSISFEQFSNMSLPIAEKKKEIIANITYVPFNIKEELKQTKVTLPIDTKTTVQELIQKVAEQLNLPEDNISKMMFALVSNENVKQEFFDKNCNKKVIEMIKECNASNTKFAVIYQLQHEYQFYSEENKVISINFKKTNNKDDNRTVIGIPRVIIINTQEIVADIYQQIAELLLSVFPEGSDMVQNLIEYEETDSNSDEVLKMLCSDLKYEVLINSEKQRRKKHNDICVFCQSTTCNSCLLPFLKDKQYSQFTQNYNKDLSITLLFNNNDIINQLPQQTFSLKDSQKADSNCPTLYECLKLNQEKEILDEDNMWDCDVCKKKQIASKEVTIYYAPRYMFLQIKRFKNNEKGEKIKNTIQVNYGEVEDFTDFIYQLNPAVNASLKNTPEKLLYRLYGVVIHKGQLDQGHYTSYTYQNDQWTFYNDDEYKQVNASEVINNKDAYLVFYELIE